MSYNHTMSTDSTPPPEAAATSNEPITKLLFDYPGADIILRSQDSHHLRVPKALITNYSPVLGELIRKTFDSLGNANAEASLPVLPLPERGEILHYLLTFIYSVIPVVPSTHEETMELLFVAQKYQVDAVLLTHIRGTIAQQNPLPTRLEPALRVYALAQEYGLRPEALQTAQTILKYSMTIEDLDNKLDIMPGAPLYELWKYYEKVQTILMSDLTEFRESGARGTITGLQCTELSSSQIPQWLDQYIESIAKTPKLFDTVEFSITMARHIKDKASVTCSRCHPQPSRTNSNSCECASIPSQTIHDFWEALEYVIHGSFEKVSGIDV